MTAPDKKCEELKPCPACKHKEAEYYHVLPDGNYGYRWCTDCGSFSKSNSVLKRWDAWQLPISPVQAVESTCKHWIDGQITGECNHQLPPPSGLAQRQDSLTDQMNTVMDLARQHGCYDAQDWIRTRFGVPGARESRPHITVKEIESFLIHPTATEVRSGNGFVNAYDWCVSFGQDKLAQAIHALLCKTGEKGGE